jgi:aminoglycoside phosphotransferase (APT) family kinase protein
MIDSDALFDDSFADADAAAALYELAAPDLPPPTSVRREAMADPEIGVWAVHAKGFYARMKVATSAAGVARLRRGAELLSTLSARGLRVPEGLLVRAKPGGSSATVALERRLGTTSAAVGWPILGAPGRVAFAEALAKAFVELHRGGAVPSGAATSGPVPPGVPLAGPAPGGEVPWRAVVEERVRARIGHLRDADVLSDDSGARTQARLLEAASRLPTNLVPTICHGAFALPAAALERRAFAGLCDFEGSCTGDPWIDVGAAVASLGDFGGAPARRFLDVYGAAVPPPADLSSRLELYGGLLLLKSLCMVATSFPSEARTAAERLTAAWS